MMSLNGICCENGIDRSDVVSGPRAGEQSISRVLDVLKFIENFGGPTI